MIEAMKQMVEALEHGLQYVEVHSSNQRRYQFCGALEAGRQAIAEAEKQEAVAMQMDVIVVNLVREGINKHRARELAEHFIKHTHPQPKREWVELTPEEEDALVEQARKVPAEVPCPDYNKRLLTLANSKLKEKNT